MRLLSFLFIFCCSSLSLLATHNRAGEIIVRASGDCADINNQLEVCATIITYTETQQTEVDRDSLDISWGDGTIQTIARTLEQNVAPG
ncbi:MAG: hypothetical protein AAGA31_09100, partial [Bacteroidota bacterium]